MRGDNVVYLGIVHLPLGCAICLLFLSGLGALPLVPRGVLLFAIFLSLV